MVNRSNSLFLDWHSLDSFCDHHLYSLQRHSGGSSLWQRTLLRSTHWHSHVLQYGKQKLMLRQATLSVLFIYKILFSIYFLFVCVRFLPLPSPADICARTETNNCDLWSSKGRHRPVLLGGVQRPAHQNEPHQPNIQSREKVGTSTQLYQSKVAVANLRRLRTHSALCHCHLAGLLTTASHQLPPDARRQQAHMSGFYQRRLLCGLYLPHHPHRYVADRSHYI